MTWLCPGTNATAPTDMGNSPLAAETGSHERPSSTDCHKPPDPDPTRIWAGSFGFTAMQLTRPETASCAAPVRLSVGNREWSHRRPSRLRRLWIERSHLLVLLLHGQLSFSCRSAIAISICAIAP